MTEQQLEGKNVQQPIGEYIRQLRRQRSLTQTELGGERFSKSYVSAVERDKILPSLEALRFFAKQLDQPSDYFEQLLQQAEQSKQLSSFNGSHPSYLINEQQENEIMTLLDLVLEGAELHTIPLLRSLGTFSREKIVAQPLPKQARYAFLQGLVAQQQEDLPTALVALEYALALAPEKYLPAILDALGTNYYLMKEYHSALSYHKRALHLLHEQPEEEISTDLLLLIELHCANDYSTLSSHHTASSHYEQARGHLRATHNMQLAAQLYKGLGYSTYAALYQDIASLHLSALSLPDSEGERKLEYTYQYALGYLIQSRALYQASHDDKGVSFVRLIHTMILLDLSGYRRQIAAFHSTTPRTTDLLIEAEEQCRQILLTGQDLLASTSLSSDGQNDNTPAQEQLVYQKNLLYTALAYLIRIHAQHAAVARIGGYDETATRERALASHICEQALAILADDSLSWHSIQDILKLPGNDINYFTQSLPHLLRQHAYTSNIQETLQVGQMELYFAAGEVAEEQGRATIIPDYAHDCFVRANECFRAALDLMRHVFPDEDHDSSYLARSQQRCMALLEERTQLIPTETEDVITMLLDILRTEVFQQEFLGM